MSRYIDADMLIEKMRGCFIDSIEENIAVQIINSAPSIDIVRCKECKYYDGCDCNMFGEPAECNSPYPESGNEFCSWGERKEQ